MDYYASLFASKISGGGGGGGDTSTFDKYLSGQDVEIRSNITSVKANAITADNITKIILPECTTLGMFAIGGAIVQPNGGQKGFTKLEELKLPKVSTIDHRSISNIVDSNPLKSVVLPSLTKIVGGTTRNAFYYNATKYYDFGSPSIVSCDLSNGKPFYNNQRIEAIILRYGGVVTIGSTSIFYKANTDSIDLGNTAFIYVPSALLEDYKVATNWATIYASYPNMFKTIEGSIYENAYADGTPIGA